MITAHQNAVRRRDRPKPYEPIIRGPLRLERARSYQPPEPPARTVEDEIVRALQAAARWNELQELKASRPSPPE
jgi:hypothetical protein